MRIQDKIDFNGGAFNLLAPFSGYKQSGIVRELGRYGLEEFLQNKVTAVAAVI